MSMFGFEPMIPHENRRELMELRDSLGLDKFLTHVWAERHKARRDALPASQCRIRSTWKWPDAWSKRRKAEALAAAKTGAPIARIGRGS